MLKNLLANYFGKFWGFISIYLFVPFYIDILGIENYGIISFNAILMSVLMIADAGLSATINREMSRSSDMNFLANLLKSIEQLYFFIIFLIILLVFFSSEHIVKHLLHSSFMDTSSKVKLINLMGVSIAITLLNSLYINGLLGLRKQVLANFSQVSFSILRQGVVILPLYFFRSLEFFFYWQIVTGIIWLFVSRKLLWGQINFTIKPRYNKTILKSVRKFSFAMMIMSLIAATNSQVDKIIIGNILNLKEFTFYSLSSLISQFSYLFILPITTAILPIITLYFEEKKLNSVLNIFLDYSFLISAISSTITMVFFVYTEMILSLWIGVEEISNEMNLVTKNLLIGGMFLTFQLMPYQMAIADGKTKTNLLLGISFAILMPVGIYFGVGKYGLVGASIPWVIFNFIAFLILGISFAIRYFSISVFFNWLYYSTFLPVLHSLLIGLGFYFISKPYLNKYNLFVFVLLAGVINFSLLLYFKSSGKVINYIKNIIKAHE